MIGWTVFALGLVALHVFLMALATMAGHASAARKAARR